MTTKKDLSKMTPRQHFPAKQEADTTRIVTCTVIPKDTHCSKCGKDFQNVDGCPDCGTDKYLTPFYRNQ